MLPKSALVLIPYEYMNVSSLSFFLSHFGLSSGKGKPKEINYCVNHSELCLSVFKFIRLFFLV